MRERGAREPNTRLFVSACTLAVLVGDFCDGFVVLGASNAKVCAVCLSVVRGACFACRALEGLEVCFGL